MASIPVTFQGVLTYSDVGVGGGPMPGGPQPSHPIAPGGPPLGFWGGTAPPYVDIGGPGPQPPSGAHPSHPIYYPPYVDAGPPAAQPHPEHPIVLPPDLPPTLPDPDNRPVNWKTAWTPVTGWIVVGIPSGTHPTPSAPAPTPS